MRAWLEANLPAGDPREWSRKIFDAGYAGLTWPEEYGGKGAPYSHQAIVLEEFARAEAPPHMGVIGLGMAGPTIMFHGTEDQKQRYLSKILSAEEIWCQGFSEPGAGSDLSAVRTRIDDQGDHFVLNGQKVWSSFAHIADHCILVGQERPGLRAARGPHVRDRRHEERRASRCGPLKQITGEAEFNEIFFTDAKVPKENLLGDIGGGLAGRDDDAPARARHARLRAERRARGAGAEGSSRWRSRGTATTRSSATGSRTSGSCSRRSS